jgi:predicted RNase H-like HicB family nuclease
MKLAITMFRDEDGWLVVECPAIPGCASQGRTEEEAIANIRDAIAGCLAVRREQGLPLTIEMREIEVPAIA